jgi:hypothetical protein
MKTYGGVEASSTFLDLGTIWKWVMSFTPLSLYPQAKSPPLPTGRGLVGPRAGLEDVYTAGNRNRNVKSAARYFTDWAIPTPVILGRWSVKVRDIEKSNLIKISVYDSLYIECYLANLFLSNNIDRTHFTASCKQQWVHSCCSSHCLHSPHSSQAHDPWHFIPVFA